MAVETEHAHFLTPGATGDATHTFANMTNKPVALIFYTTGTTNANLDTAEAELITGIGIGTQNSTGANDDQYAIGQFSQDNVGTSSCFNRHSNVEVITIIDSAGALVAEGNLKSTAAGSPSSFVITWMTVPGTAIEFHVWAVAGTDMVDAVVGTFNADTATGNRDITNIGLSDGGAPDMVFFLTSQSGSTSNAPPFTANANAGLTIGGMMDNNGAFGFSYVAEDNVATSNTQTLASAAYRVLSVKGGVTAGTYSHQYVGMLPDGFRINTVDAAAIAFPIFYLAIRGGNWNRVGLVAPNTGTVPFNLSYDNDDDFTPRGFLALAENTARDSLGIGGSSSAGGIVDGATGVADLDGQGTTITAHRMTVDSCVLVIDAGGTVQWEANTASYDAGGGGSGGVTLTWTTRQGSGGDAVNLIMVGDGGSAPPTARRRQNVAVI